jgi:predicted amidohydrolase YtcJ
MFVSNTRAAALATLAVVMATVVSCSRPPRVAADLVVTRASIWTGNPAQPSAMAVAVIGDRIVDVGGADEIERWRGANTTVLDAEGRRLIPGFNDAAVRFGEGGDELENVDLREAGTAAEFARRINERAKGKPGEWITGGHWDERRWTPATLPARTLIDDATNSSPVFVVRFDGRMALANAAALGRAGITEGTADPPGGALLRDANGFPTGLLQGTAMELVSRVIPKVTPEQRLRAVKRALEHAESLGVTSVQDVGATYEDIAAYGDLVNRGELTVRVYAVPAEGGWYDQAKLGLHRAFGSAWLRVGAVRAAFDRGGDAGEMTTRLMAADHAGLQVSVEAPGDQSIPPVLGVLDDIARANGGRDRRFRIEVSQDAALDLGRVASLNAIACLQPAPAGRSLRPLIDKGIRVALGSGWPAGPLNPMLTLDAAIARQLTVTDALSAYTSGSAFAEFQERDKGIIARGQLADMIMLSDDILSIAPARIKGVQVLATIVGGRIVHQRKP